MARDISKDKKPLNCILDADINYVANLYEEPLRVKQFLFLKCSAGIIKYMTHHDVYRLIEIELGYPIPE